MKTFLSRHVAPSGSLTRHRPEARNALGAGLIGELDSALDSFEADDAVGAIVITGNEKTFAAGAAIEEMQSKSFIDVFSEDFITSGRERVTTCRKPVIAALAGFALGAGCEIAMMCDFILAANNAKFGRPEIKLGVIPGSGGTQRLTRLVGKSKAIEIVLTGRMMDAAEAERAGLVSRIVPDSDLVEEAVKIAAEIAALSRPAVMMANEAVNPSYETTLRKVFGSDADNFTRHLRSRIKKRNGGVHRNAKTRFQERLTWPGWPRGEGAGGRPNSRGEAEAGS